MTFQTSMCLTIKYNCIAHGFPLQLNNIIFIDVMSFIADREYILYSELLRIMLIKDQNEHNRPYSSTYPGILNLVLELSIFLSVITAIA